MTSDDTLHRRGGATLAGAAAVCRSRSPRSRAGDNDQAPRRMPPLHPANGRPYNPVVTLERLDPAVAHERRRQGVPPRRRTGGARDGARHEGPPVGLQRPEPGADDRGPSRATGCASSSPTGCPSTRRFTGTASACRTAWTALAASPSRRSPRARPSSTSSSRAARHVHVSPARRRDGPDGDGHDGLSGSRTRERSIR